jgi:hypothetical protein
MKTGEDELAMIAKKFRRLLKFKRFKKFFDNFQGKPTNTKQEHGDTDEKDLRGPRCFECTGFGHTISSR